MNDGTEDKAKKLLEEIERIRDNEREKFIAAAFDRLSTALVGIGAIGPVVTLLFSNGPLLPWELIKLSAAFVTCCLTAYALHLLGRRCLKRLR